jgi:hypothetical protein
MFASERLHLDNLKTQKCCLKRDGSPIIFVAHESQIQQSGGNFEFILGSQGRPLDDKVVRQLAAEMQNNPNAIQPDPYQVSILPEINKPWTLDRKSFLAKYHAEAMYFGLTEFLCRNWSHQHLFASRKMAANHFAGTVHESSFRYHQVG